ncbi:MAG TPA: hypothetical protein VJR29_04505 [bacterium]|nr:hypothetical protein [bacterium]
MVFLGLLAELWRHFLPSPLAEAWAPLFSLSFEGNVPTWYSSCLLFWCGLILIEIAGGIRKRRAAYGRHWTFLGIGFFYMSLDEAIGIHESLGGITGSGGILYYDWIVPAAVLLLILALFYWPFLGSLRPDLRRRFLLAATLYVGGAVGMELPLGYWVTRFGDDGFGYAGLDLVEEALELVGATLFLTTLIGELRSGREGGLA